MKMSTRSSSTSAAADGRLAASAAHATGGRGNGVPHLPSQSSIVISPDARFVLVANTGSGDVSTFAITPRGINLTGRTAVGDAPTSIAIHRDLVYVLTTGDDTGVRGFRLAADGGLVALAGGRLELSAPDADPAQVAFSPDGATLVVSERGTDSLTTFAIAADGSTAPAASLPPPGRLRTASSSRRRADSSSPRLPAVRSARHPHPPTGSRARAD